MGTVSVVSSHHHLPERIVAIALTESLNRELKSVVFCVEVSRVRVW